MVLMFRVGLRLRVKVKVKVKRFGFQGFRVFRSLGVSCSRFHVPRSAASRFMGKS
jgi:hypothetical protein